MCSSDLVSDFEGVGKYQRGDLDDKGLDELERLACPTCGSCSGMFTANSMNCIMEVLGLALPGNGSILAVDPRREKLARSAATRIVEMVDEDLKVRDIDRKSTRLNSSHVVISYAVFCLKKKKQITHTTLSA